MLPTKDWNKEAKRILKAQLARRDITYDELSAKLKANGIDISAKNLATKINRGRFSFAFALQVMDALSIRKVELIAD